MRTIKGDLVKLAAIGEFDVIIHGCNCFNTMGAGIAAQIAKKFPAAATVDRFTTIGDRNKLGNYTIASVLTDYGDPLLIVNAYTQYGYGRLSPAVDYDAVQKIFAGVVWNLARIRHDIRIGIPMIGAGLAGGDWKRINSIIEYEMYGIRSDILTLVEYDK